MNYDKEIKTPAEFECEAELKTLPHHHMPKPSEIFDTPEANGFSRVGENEEIVEKLQIFKFNREKDNGYGITHDDYIEFFLTTLTTKDQEKEEAIRAEKNKTINRVLNIVSSKQNQFTSTYERGYQEAVKNILKSIQRLLPTEDNK